jgi:hypothetical protein
MVLELRAFLKEKQDSKTKARTVAGGNKQRGYIRKEDASSPDAVATESVLLTCIVDAEEGRDVAVIDTPDAFVWMHVEDEKDMAFIKIRGVVLDILVEIAPDVCKRSASRGKRKELSSCWFSARTPSAVRWSRACCTVESLLRV